MVVTFKIAEVTPEKIDREKATTYQDLARFDWEEHDTHASTRRRDPGEAQRKPYRSHLLQNSFAGRSEFMRCGVNSFVHSAIQAYNHHHKLVIRPDDVWLSIVAQFSVFVNQHAEKLREKFVDFSGKEEIKIELEAPVREIGYPVLLQKFETEIAKRVKDPDLHSWIIPDFTTTTETDRVVGQIALMSSLQQFFKYVSFFMCGIPEVTMLGSIEDWENVRKRAEKIIEYDTEKGYMKKWSELLLPVLDQLVLSAKGQADITWWNKIATCVGEGSTVHYLSGWLSVFCIFDNVGKWLGESKITEIYDPTKGVVVPQVTEWICCNLLYIPKGYIKVPVKLKEFPNRAKTVYLFGGHIVSNIVDDFTIAPSIDWMVLHCKEAKEDKKKAKEEPDEDFRRRPLVDAAIVRVMKKHDMLSYGDLVPLLEAELQKLFVPSEESIKSRLQSLTEREYIEVLDNDMYKYLP